MKNVWMIRAGAGGYLINEFMKKKIVAIGWDELGDLTNVKSQEALKKLYQQTYPQEKPGKMLALSPSSTSFAESRKKLTPSSLMIQTLASISSVKLRAIIITSRL